MKFSMILKKILSIVLVLTLQTQAISSHLVVNSKTGSPLADPTTTVAIAAVVSGGNGTALAAPELAEIGTSATITITPDVGYHIATVIDNEVDVTPLVVAGVYTISDVQVAHAVTVTFAINEYALSVTVETTLTGTVNGVESISQTLTHGSIIALTAEPAKGYLFSHWLINGENAGSDNPLTLTMDGAKTVVAVFTDDPLVLSARALVTFFEENTVLGTLTGIAKTDRAQQGRLKAFDNKLKAVVNSLLEGNNDDAIGLLTSTLAKGDGELNPPDFVGGDQSDELAAMIQALIEALSPQLPQ